MIGITKDQVKHISRLSKLSLSKDEVNKFQKQLGEIVEYVRTLDLVKLNDTAPTSQTTELTNVYRNDLIGVDGLDQKSALSGTEDEYNGYFKIPSVFKKV